MKAFSLTSLFVLVASMQIAGQPMLGKNSKTVAASQDKPKTISGMVGEVRAMIKELKLQFHAGTTDEEIIFGLQHTVADQRTNDKGKPFPVTTEYLPKIVDYYRAMIAAVKDNKSDLEILPLFVDALQDMSISGEESSRIAKGTRLIQQENNLNSRAIFKAENRDTNRDPNVAGYDNKSEVDKDPRLLAKDKDGMNEGIAFEMAGQQKIFTKQYLASLLEPIRESTAVGQSQNSNKSLPQGQTATDPALVKNK